MTRWLVTRMPASPATRQIHDMLEFKWVIRDLADHCTNELRVAGIVLDQQYLDTVVGHLGCALR